MPMRVPVTVRHPIKFRTHVCTYCNCILLSVVPQLPANANREDIISAFNGMQTNFMYQLSEERKDSRYRYSALNHKHRNLEDDHKGLQDKMGEVCTQVSSLQQRNSMLSIAVAKMKWDLYNVRVTFIERIIITHDSLTLLFVP